MGNMLKNTLVEMLNDSNVLASVDNLLSALVAVSIKQSYQLAVNNVAETRKRIKDQGPKQHWIDDIDENYKTMRALEEVYHYYTGDKLVVDKPSKMTDDSMYYEEDEYYEDYRSGGC